MRASHLTALLAVLLAAVTSPAVAQPQSFVLRDALINCTAACLKAGAGMVPVSLGYKSKLLCSSKQGFGGKLRWGTWIKGSCYLHKPLSPPDNEYPTDTYQCACRKSTTLLSFIQGPACPSGTSLAYSQPPVCRAHRLASAGGAADAQFGYFEDGFCNVAAGSWSGDDFVWKIPGPGGPYKVEIMCGAAASSGRRRLEAADDTALPPLKRRSRRLSGLEPVTHISVTTGDQDLPDCTYTCGEGGRVPVDSGGVYKEQLCSVTRLIGNVPVRLYGTLAGAAGKGQKCSFAFFTLSLESGLLSTGFQCACRDAASKPLFLETEQCATGPFAAAKYVLSQDMAVCRARKPGTGSLRFGHYDVDNHRCIIPPTTWGINSKLDGGPAGPYDVRIMCRTPPARNKCAGVPSSRSGLVQVAKGLTQIESGIGAASGYASRWQAILDGICPANYPTTADPPSLMTWIYWTVFGKGTDRLNVNNWTEASLASLGTYGLQRSEATYQPAVPTPPFVPVDLTKAQLGDLIFYGSSKFNSHVAIYVGNNQVVSYGGNDPGKTSGKPVLKPAAGNWTLPGSSLRLFPNELRSYTDFLI